MAAQSEKLPAWISAEDVGEKQKCDTYIPVLDGRVLCFLVAIGSAVLVIFDDMYQKNFISSHRLLNSAANSSDFSQWTIALTILVGRLF